MRFIISLFKPKYIGKYISDTYFRVVFYAIFFVLLICIPSINSSLKVDNITYYSENALFQSIYRAGSDNVNYVISDNTLNTDSTAYFKGSSVDVYFNKEVSSANTNTLVYVFNSKSVTLIYNGVKYSAISYENLSKSSFNLNDVYSIDFDAIAEFLGVLNLCYEKVQKYNMPIYVVTSIFYTLIEFAIAVAFFMFIGARINPMIPSNVRFRIVIYSLSWCFLLSAIGAFVGGETVLFIIGIFISFFCMVSALKNLTVIKQG